MKVRILAAVGLLFLLYGCGGKSVTPDPTQQNDKEMYERGVKHLEDKDYQKAREAFKIVFDNFPKSDYRILSKLGYADSYYQDGGDANWLLAIQEYQDFISLFPFHPKAEYAQAQIGMSYFMMREKPDRDQSNTKKALEEFRKVIDNYPDGQYYKTSYEKLIDSYKLLAEHEYIIAFYYHRTGRHAAAIDRLKGLLKNFPESAYNAQIYWLLGSCLEDENQSTEACAHYNTALTRWPDDEVISRVKEGIARVCPN
jgi:outer membrane protein assembly factor BamD